jgi:hypothetical protein
MVVQRLRVAIVDWTNLIFPLQTDWPAKFAVSRVFFVNAYDRLASMAAGFRLLSNTRRVEHGWWPAQL